MDIIPSEHIVLKGGTQDIIQSFLNALIAIVILYFKMLDF